MAKLIIIYGPTAVGKSDFGEQLAATLQGEIINGDIGQCYTPLTIGTAKPDWRHAEITHHLFDIIDEPKNFTVVEYRRRVEAALDDIVARKKVPIIIGGSGFYLKSLFFPPRASKIVTTKPIYAPEELRWQQLYELDPDRAKNIHPNDIYRIDRALDIYFETGKKASEYTVEYKRIMPYIFLDLNRNRVDLYDRINKRTEQMLTHGWIDEVKSLSAGWKQFMLEKKLIGYDDIIRYLESGLDDTAALNRIIAQKTRNYAKRQITFGKMFMRQLLAHHQQENYQLRSHIKSFELSSDYSLFFQEVSNLLKY